MFWREAPENFGTFRRLLQKNKTPDQNFQTFDLDLKKNDPGIDQKIDFELRGGF